ncbi:recombinase family protein [Rhizobium cremeum]|uniref:recombinase family protein n=1 Tax=Rhizobium cremeum TaxID=2813827 RepID=UPI000DDD45F6|nr:recombinase family protein [Rhizobium cremeum]MCJ7995252.1 recombinase family protein [Rhizobium cremeum]MCJ8000436.1 recombinase family protein [Rhizobium cremeum]
MTTQYVSYLRVSTKEQGRSGLGLEAQREAVATYLTGQGAKLACEFIEVESGKRTDRPKLAEALTMCRALGARLVVAKIDRLARNVHFVSGLMESGVDFVAADMPSVNRLTIHVLAAVAEEEARAISKRTKDALAAAKARGKKLGGTRHRKETGEVVMTLTDDMRKEAAHVRSQKAHRRASDVLPIVAAIRTEIGSDASLGAIAKALTERGVKTPSGRGAEWSAVQVSRLLARAA